MAHLLDRAALWLAAKAAGATVPLPLPSMSVPQGLDWFRPTQRTPTARAMIQEGLKRNSAVFACISKISTGFAEPPLNVYRRRSDGKPGDLVAGHPLQALLNRPNPLMGQDEWLSMLAAYRAVGGNAYSYKLRDRTGRPAELWPYHAANIVPVPGSVAWIDHYAFDRTPAPPQRIEAADIIHWKATLVDPEAPWRGLPPLQAVAPETDTDNELTAYLFALLKNDAVPRGILTLPAGTQMSDTEFRRFKDRWKAQFGNDKRGDLAVVEGGLTYQRTALNLQELAFDALRSVPEARICAAFGVPPMTVGLNVGLQYATYSNLQEANKDFTQRKLVADWKSLESELNADLVPEFDATGSIMVAFDLGQVQALQESDDSKHERLFDAYRFGVLQLNEVRAKLGYDAVADGNRFAAPPAVGVGALPPAGSPAGDAAGGKRGAKAAAPVRPAGVDRLESRFQRELEAQLQASYAAVAAAMERSA